MTRFTRNRLAITALVAGPGNLGLGKTGQCERAQIKGHGRLNGHQTCDSKCLAEATGGETKRFERHKIIPKLKALSLGYRKLHPLSILSNLGLP
jgi:hypothetical protein